MKNLYVFFFCLAFMCGSAARAGTLEIGADKQFSNLAAAAQQAEPGDTLLFFPGTFSGGQSFTNLQGTATNFIVITTVEANSVIIRGGTTAWQLTDAAYVHVSGFIFEGQTGNGVNFDDGGDYATPAHHIIFDHCTFRNINATGNNDLLKLSGVDDFQIKNCKFENGSPGGSGIDMVGCHNGEILSSTFRNMGSNAIQAKGGSQFLRIERNWFENCGERSVNLGGSTGLPYFRPLDAPFEAADLHVYSNVFVGSVAPIAYVGCVRTDVINNTIVYPEKWVVRILQESVDTNRFLECGENTFQNNLVYQRTLGTETNIGPTTRPETFHFQSNFWFNVENAHWSGPNTPVDDPEQVINRDPLFVDVDNGDFSLQTTSPAISLVYFNDDPLFDYIGSLYQSPRSVGAFEGGSVSSVKKHQNDVDILCRVLPNPLQNLAIFHYKIRCASQTSLRLYDIRGRLVNTIVNTELQPGEYGVPVDFSQLPNGVYFYLLINGMDRTSGKITVIGME